jgi:predicted permease
MDQLFYSSFLTVGGALLKIFLIAALAGYMSLRRIVTEDFIDGLSGLVVKVFLPLQIFSNILMNFDPSEQTYWWSVPLFGILLGVFGLLFSALLFAGNIREKKALFPLSGMQNAVYLILPIGEFAFKDQFPEFSFICFLVLMGLNPLMWSVGKILITESNKNGSFLSRIITPPFIACLTAIALVLLKIKNVIPHFVVDSADFLGEATVPVATFILGSTLAMSMKSIPPFRDTFRVVFIKFIVIPAMVIVGLLWLKTGEAYPLLAQVLVIQAAAAPATAHILMVRTYGGDIRKTGGIIFVSYLICLPAIPFWLSLWNYLSV